MNRRSEPCPFSGSPKVKASLSLWGTEVPTNSVTQLYKFSTTWSQNDIFIFDWSYILINRELSYMPYTNDCSYENLNVIKFTNRNAKVNEIYIFVSNSKDRSESVH